MMVRGRLPRALRKHQEPESGREPRGKRREQEVFRIARHVANTLKLPIKIVLARAETNGRIVVFFASEERIDFRELFRRVSAAAQGRVELRQIGVRDAATVYRLRVLLVYWFTALRSRINRECTQMHANGAFLLAFISVH